MQRIRLIIVASLLALSLVGCAQQRADSAPEEVAALPATFANVVAASGKVVPAEWATLSFETGGPVEWLVAEGSQVAAGDTLARLDATDLEHAVALPGRRWRRLRRNWWRPRPALLRRRQLPLRELSSWRREA